jgi:hypothetical protein
MRTYWRLCMDSQMHVYASTVPGLGRALEFEEAHSGSRCMALGARIGTSRVHLPVRFPIVPVPGQFAAGLPFLQDRFARRTAG